MAVTGLMRDMNDFSRKPRLLRSLLDEVLDEERDFGSILTLTDVVWQIKSYKLLSEDCAESTDSKVVGSWKSAMDAWIDRLTALVSSSNPSKCLVGICLLRMTCEDCSADRFLSSYHVFLHNLLPHLQKSTIHYIVLVASCTAISGILRRLGCCFPSLKKEGNIEAGKVVQPVLNMINDIGWESESSLEALCALLCEILTCFPNSVRRSYENVENVLLSKFVSGKFSTLMLNNLSNCLALLPKSKGDADCWSQLMLKIFFSVNSYLNDVFQGFEDENMRDETSRLLYPTGKDSIPLLGFQGIIGEVLGKSNEKHCDLSLPVVSCLLHCCCVMLSSCYPTEVCIPVQKLLSLVRRMLMVNGSVPQSLSPFINRVQQDFICSQLQVLHSCSLDLLIAIINGYRSHLLPYSAQFVNIIAQYLKTCALPEHRGKAYYVVKILLVWMGPGTTPYLGHELIKHAFVDLNPDSGKNNNGISPGKETELLPVGSLKHCKKKRKHTVVTTEISAEKSQDNNGFGMEMSSMTTQLTMKIAALEALEALLTSRGLLISESSHVKSDLLVMNVATYVCKGRWACSFNCRWVNFQLASLRALLASLLSRPHARTQYLSRGRELFYEGREEGRTRVADFCVSALLALDVLVRPKSSPTFNSQVGGQSPENSYEPRTTIHIEPNLPESDSESDELYHKYQNLVIPDFPEKNISLNSSSPKVPAEDGKNLIDPENNFLHLSSPKVPAEDEKSEGMSDLYEADNSILAVKPDLPVALHCDRDMHKCENSEVSNMLLTRDGGTEGEIPSRCMWLDSKGARKHLLAEQQESSSDSFPDIVDQEPDSD